MRVNTVVPTRGRREVRVGVVQGRDGLFMNGRVAVRKVESCPILAQRAPLRVGLWRLSLAMSSLPAA